MLKPGILLIQLNRNEFYVGEEGAGLYVPSDPYLSIARACDGTRSTGSIAELCNLDHEVILDFLKELTTHNYVEFRTSTPQKLGLNLLKNHYLERVTPEFDLYTWRAATSDGGEREVASRKSFAILIFGDNRLSRALLANLQASGFSQSKIFATPESSNKRTSPKDVCGVFVKPLDIGRKYLEINKEIIGSSQLTYAEHAIDLAPQLIISTGNTEFDFIQPWTSEGIPHLQISMPTSHTLEIGPLVIPSDTSTAASGSSACLNCVRLHRRDYVPLFISIATQNNTIQLKSREMTTASTSFAAGAVTSYICEFAAGGRTSLINHSLTIDLLKPLEGIRHHHWSMHPECGCASSNALVHQLSL